MDKSEIHSLILSSNTKLKKTLTLRNPSQKKKITSPIGKFCAFNANKDKLKKLKLNWSSFNLSRSHEL